MKKLLFLALVFLVGTEGWGQVVKCGVTSSISEPLTPQRILELQKLDSIERLFQGPQSITSNPKIIPVVVHILHKNETDKIAYKRAEDAILQLNQAYSASAQSHYSQGLNTNFSFCLVYVDWVVSEMTDFKFETHNLAAIPIGGKSLGWDKNNYLNIYVVNSIKKNGEAYGGFGYTPDALASVNMKFDGVVIVNGGFGLVIGVGIIAPLLPHEVGHYLGLYHTFQGGCDENRFLNLLCNVLGDKVCDTPPCDLSDPIKFPNGSYTKGNTVPFNTCSLGGNDLEDNFMCYNEDYKEPDKFTQGQIDRMHRIVEDWRGRTYSIQGCEEFENRYFEPNNVSTSSTTVIFPSLSSNPYESTLSSRLSSQSDIDFYKIKVSSLGNLNINLKNLTGGKIALVDNNGLNILSISIGTNEENISYNISSSGGLPRELFVKVYSPLGWNSLNNKYNLKITWGKCLDIIEPNDSYTAATNTFSTIGNLNTNGTKTVESVIGTGSDRDWYKLVLNGGGILTVNLDNLPKDYNVELMDANGNVVKKSDGSKVGSYNTGQANETFSYANSETNNYFIRVFPLDFNQYDLCVPYSLKATWVADGVCLPVAATYVPTKASSASTNNGAITLTVTAGQSPFTYLWSNGATTKDISGIGDGDYTVTITGKDGCKKTLVITVGTQSTGTPFCSGTSTLTTTTGSFSDKSGSADYVNNSFCRWLIKPLNARTVKLRFTAFKLHASDKVRIYNGSSASAPLLAEYNADSIPPPVTSTGGVMYVQFSADAASTSEGFSAAYTATIDDGINQITSYDYWFDDKFADKRSFTVTERNTLTLQGSIPTDELGVGLHAINFRFNDQYDQPSPVTTDLFIKTPQNTEGGALGIKSYEYWYDSDFDSRLGLDFDAVETFNLNQSFDASGLPYGVHAFNVRFKDNANNWSTTTTDLFVKTNAPSSGMAQIVGYEYWFDDKYSSKVSQTITPSETYTLMTNLNVTALAYGLHTFQVRFLDAAGQWSTTTTDIFVKVKSTANGLSQIVGYDYWFDDKFSTKISQTVTATETYSFISNLNVTALTFGLHAFNIRFLDAAGQYSTTTTDLFIKERHALGDSKITQYQYWFDDNFQSKVSQTVTPVETYSLVSNISTSSLLNGIHRISFRFLDESQNWSPIVKDTFTKNGIIPVELTKFIGKCQDDKVTLNWQTASEQNSDYFELLFSTSPQSGWKTLTTMPSKGNSSALTNYNYLFDKPTRLTYYRLKQVDKDGKFYYSSTIAVECAGKEHYLKVFPNPATDEINLETDINDGDLTIDICNAVGQSLLRKRYTSGFYPIIIPLTELASGVYFVKVSAGNNEVIGVKQVVKQ
jgi:hypothetical protein